VTTRQLSREPSRRIELEVCPGRAHSGQPLSLRLINLGQSDLGYGLGFKVQRRVHGVWSSKDVMNQCAWTSQLLRLEVDASREEPLGIARRRNACLDLTAKGLHRVTKTFCGDSCRINLRVSATFRVE